MTVDNEVLSDINKEIENQMEKRKKSLVRYQVPENRNLLNALLTLSKAELDDIRYNLCVQGISSLKKQEMAEALVPEILRFSKKWLTTISMEQYEVLKHIAKNDGLNTEIGMEDLRIDYMRCIGILFSGISEEKQAWYLPDEVLAIYRTLDSNTSYKEEISLNEEVVRLTTGLLFYYGYLQYDLLFEKVSGFLNEELSFIDFMGILINAGCWQGIIVNVELGAHYYTVLDHEQIANCQIERSDIEFFPFSYEQIYQAGEANYIEETTAYKALAGFLMKEFSLPVLTAVDLVGEMNIMLLNGDSFSEIIEYLQERVYFPSMKIVDRLMQILVEFNNTSLLWLLKGYSPNGLRQKSAAVGKADLNNLVKFVPPNSVIGRNDPCPCGSGIKYKKCCIDKEI